MQFVSATCLTLLALVFAAAVVGKTRTAASVTAFTDAVTVLGRTPAHRAGVVAAVIITLEAATALLLVTPWFRGAGLLLAAGLLASFSYAVARALRAGSTVSCRCFGASAGPVGPPQLLRNALLLVAVAAAVPGVLNGPGELPWQARFAAWLSGATAALVLVVGEELASLLRRAPARTAPAAPHL
ncbi:MauE/DoxX family redox-associated membrane protein [Streptomyces sp. NPDC006645]|uniref:MauE/DoxX family redox-associated membrane protein n=1 Tax=unclassified Streptomyces TaxID=2593676 RepID=UPI0033B8AFA3